MKKVDSFRVLVSFLENEKDRWYLHTLYTQEYPDAFEEVIKRDEQNAPREFIIKNTPRGLYVLKMIEERFGLSVRIFAQKEIVSLPRMLKEVGDRWTPKLEKDLTEKSSEILNEMLYPY